jgi:hypothetical protein
MNRRARAMLFAGVAVASLAATAWLLDRRSAELVGAARVIDGDSIVVADTEIRLYGIDAPNTDKPVCGPDLPGGAASRPPPLCGGWLQAARSGVGRGNLIAMGAPSRCALSGRSIWAPPWSRAASRSRMVPTRQMNARRRTLAAACGHLRSKFPMRGGRAIGEPAVDKTIQHDRLDDAALTPAQCRVGARQ